jgi:hypothetical protein
MTKPYNATQPYYVGSWIDPYYWQGKRPPQDIAAYIEIIVDHLDNGDMRRALWYWELCCLMDTKL